MNPKSPISPLHAEKIAEAVLAKCEQVFPFLSVLEGRIIIDLNNN